MVDQVSTLGAPYENWSSPSLQKTETLAASPLSDKGISEKRKRGLEGRDEPCNEDNSLEKIRKVNTASDSNRNISTRLACPFFKRNPRLYRGSTFGSRSCRFPGFTTIHRLKEHLYRAHSLPIQCPRCGKSFTVESDLDAHLRSAPSCEIRENARMQGMNKEQEKKLRSKKRSADVQSEEDKWKAVYRILFPDDDPSVMPSPYFEYDQTTNGGDEMSVSEFVGFEEYSRRELPQVVKIQLERVMDKEVEPFKEQLHSLLMNLVRNCQDSLLKSYHQTVLEKRIPRGLLNDESLRMDEGFKAKPQDTGSTSKEIEDQERDGPSPRDSTVQARTVLSSFSNTRDSHSASVASAVQMSPSSGSNAAAASGRSSTSKSRKTHSTDADSSAEMNPPEQDICLSSRPSQSASHQTDQFLHAARGAK